MRTGVYTVSLHRGTNECVRKMQRFNVDTLIVVDNDGRYEGTVSIADIRLNGHVVTDIAPAGTHEHPRRPRRRRRQGLL